jgi:hypothetical protein
VILILALAASLARPAAAASTPAVDLVKYFINTPTEDANPKLAEAFLAVDPETLPKALRDRCRSKQVEMRALLRVHQIKKNGSIVQTDGTGDASSFIRPLKDITIYRAAGFLDISDSEEDFVMNKTKCTEVELGTKFTLVIFHDHGKPRRLMLHGNDPLQAMVAEARGKVGGQTHFFGVGIFTCQKMN